MIRLARVGARKQPHYRVVVIEKDRARNGRSVEVVGTYNPRTTPASLTLKRERIDYWVGNGARLSDRVGKLYAAPVVAPVAAPVVEPVAEPVAAPTTTSITEPDTEPAPAA
jgi:small subunit ribosomal protein S16